MKKIIKVSYELEVGDKFISNDNEDWMEDFRNAEFTVLNIDEYGCYIADEYGDVWFDSDDINWDETIKLNEIKEEIK